MMLRLLAVLAAFIPFASAFSQTPVEADLRRHIEILASDEFQGREPGTAGEALTVNYIANQLSAAGLLPGYNGNFFQSVALVTRADDQAYIRTTDSAGVVRTGGEIIALGNRENVVLSNMPVIFVGYALDILDGDGGNLADMRFDGQVVVLLRGTPDNHAESPSFRARLPFFRARGAAAIVGIEAPDVPWGASLNSLRFRQTYRASSARANIEAIISASTADMLFEHAGYSRDALTAMAAAGDFVAARLDLYLDLGAETLIDRYDGINVVARLPGHAETGETVMFTAHHDHFGICQPDDPNDQICNGAVDNASGTAALIETARALAGSDALARDILFVTTTAEESGLLGAFAFVEEPPLPLENVVALFNLDTIAIAPRGMPVGIVGRGLTPLDSLIDTVTLEQNRNIYRGTDIDAFVRRQDGWAFLQNGMPAVMVGGSFVDRELLTRFLRGPYHGPDDEIEGIELGGAVEDLLLHIALGRAFADPARYPTSGR